MIVFTGVGSFLSDRLSLTRKTILLAIPVAIVAMLAIAAAFRQPGLNQAARQSLAGRTALVLAFTMPVSLLLGFCFPVGMRLVGQHSATTTAWMWGINGACGVLSSVLAVAVSMSIGIDANLIFAGGLYLLLIVPMRNLLRGAAHLPGAASLEPLKD
jgi:hypothetical protein